MKLQAGMWCTCEPKGVGDAAGQEVQAVAGGYVGRDGYAQACRTMQKAY